MSGIRRLTCCYGLCLAMVIGCGGSSGPVRNYADVTGKVTNKGQALKKGTVAFQPDAGGESVSGDIQADGTYKLKGVIGSNTVMVLPPPAPPAPRLGDDPAANKKAFMEAEAAKAAAAKTDPHAIPPKYTTPTSPLKFDVKAGTNKFDVDLQ